MSALVDDLEEYRYEIPASKRARSRRTHHGAGERFLKGPIPLRWLERAGQQSGQALHVGVVLWFLRGVTGDKVIVLSAKALRRFGVSQWAGYRGLKALERAKLVTVERHCGRQPRVTLLEVS
jgi:hypothetical protein